jgi:hypothetical protein
VVAEFSYLLGQSWEYIDDHLTVAKISAYRKYWKNAPHIDALAAAFMGFKPRTEVSNDEALESIAPMFGGIPHG